MSEGTGRSTMNESCKNSVELATRTPLPQSTSTLYFTRTREGGESTGSTAEDGRRSSESSIPAWASSQLPPVDGGFGAWSFLAGAFMVETIVWGFPTSYGTFLDAYLDDPRFKSQQNATSLLALVGPVASGIMYCGSPVINPIVARHPRYRRPLIWLGTCLCFLSLFCASYAKTVAQLVALQGVMYALGGSMIYAPTICYMSQWFSARRGLANGVMFAGTSLGGIVLPLVFPPLLARFGIATTLRIFAGAVVACLMPLLPFIKGRIPDALSSPVHGPQPRNRKEWYRERAFQFLLATNTLQAFGYFVPLVWLPTFASALNLNASRSSLTLALLNAASATGRLSMGIISDRFDPWAIAFGTLLLTSFAAFVLWGVLSHTFAGLVAFGIAYGAFSGGWSTLWTGFLRPIAKDDPNYSTTLFGWLLLTRGLGNILSTPISTALEKHVSGSKDATLDIGFHVAGGRFEKMIVYTGTCFAAAALVVIIGWGVEKKKRHQTTGIEL
ncbi:major facilitator superfamily domain-containing protein [Schizophyllum commune]